MNLSLSQEIVALIILAGVVGAFGMWCAMKAMGYARWATGHSVGWQEEHDTKQRNRALRIKQWTNDKMNSIPERCRLVDYHVLVSYEELLKIWDTADHLLEDL